MIKNTSFKEKKHHYFFRYCKRCEERFQPFTKNSKYCRECVRIIRRSLPPSKKMKPKSKKQKFNYNKSYVVLNAETGKVVDYFRMSYNAHIFLEKMRRNNPEKTYKLKQLKNTLFNKLDDKTGGGDSALLL